MSALAEVLSINSISPMREMGAYEALWVKTSATFKRLADKFRARPDAVPSDFVAPSVADKFAEQALEILNRADVQRFGVLVHGAGEYPQRLRETDHPVELLYYQGWWDLIESRCVAVVGTRTPAVDPSAETVE
jgi:DNA processing protein